MPNSDVDFVRPRITGYEASLIRDGISKYLAGEDVTKWERQALENHVERLTKLSAYWELREQLRALKASPSVEGLE